MQTWRGREGEGVRKAICCWACPLAGLQASRTCRRLTQCWPQSTVVLVQVWVVGPGFTRCQRAMTSDSFSLRILFSHTHLPFQSRCESSLSRATPFRCMPFRGRYGLGNRALGMQTWSESPTAQPLDCPSPSPSPGEFLCPPLRFYPGSGAIAANIAEC